MFIDRNPAVLLVAIAVGLGGGCGPVEPGTAPADSSDQTGAGIDKYETGDLQVSVGDYMPALLGGSLEVAAPQGWDWTRPGSPYIVGFIPKGSKLNGLPRILVSAEDSPCPGLSRVTKDNVQELADLVSQRLAGEKLSEPVRPILLGSNAVVCYTTPAKKKNAVVTQHFLETVAGGRHYTIRLEVYERQFGKQHRDAAYAVAMSMKFGSAADVPSVDEPVAPDSGPAPSSTSE